MVDLELERKVKDLVRLRGLTMKKLCEEIEMTEQGLSNSFKTNKLKIETLQKIAKVADVPIDYFFMNEQKKEKNQDELLKKISELEENIEFLLKRTDRYVLEIEDIALNVFFYEYNRFFEMLNWYSKKNNERILAFTLEAYVNVLELGDKIIYSEFLSVISDTILIKKDFLQYRSLTWFKQYKSEIKDFLIKHDRYYSKVLIRGGHINLALKQFGIDINSLIKERIRSEMSKRLDQLNSKEQTKRNKK